MFRVLTAPFSRFVERWMPAPIVFAVALTAIVFICAWIATPIGPVELVASWGDGLAGLLAFTTQMCLILLLGHALANTRPIRRALVAAASIPRTEYQAYAFVTLVACAAAMLTWGLGLVVGGLLSRQVAIQAQKKGLVVHFPLLVACAYTSMSVWSMGYSSSAALAVATPDSFIMETLGSVIPVTQTLLQPWNLVGMVVAVAALTFIMPTLAPKDPSSIKTLPRDLELGVEEVEVDMYEEDDSPAAKIDRSRIVPLVLGLLTVAYIVWYFATNGFALTLDIVNWTFLAALLLLSTSTNELGALIKDAASNVGDILVQFPFYAGIMGMITASGLGSMISGWFVEISTPMTFGVLAFISAAILNIAIPSAGGQFAIQGPIMIDAAQQLGVDPAVATMALAYGDGLTNMVQPLFALPLLAIAGCRLRDIVGFTGASMLISGPILAIVIFIAGL